MQTDLGIYSGKSSGTSDALEQGLKKHPDVFEKTSGCFFKNGLIFSKNILMFFEKQPGVFFTCKNIDLESLSKPGISAAAYILLSFIFFTHLWALSSRE